MILEVNWPLLQRLGWRQSADGSAEAPADASCRGFPHRFPSPAHAVTFARNQTPALSPLVADDVVERAALTIAGSLRPLGWRTRPPVDALTASVGGFGDLSDAFPPRSLAFVVPPDSRFPLAGVEGEDFFSPRALLRLLLEVAEGGREFHGLGQEAAARLIQGEAFRSVWHHCLLESDGWDVTCVNSTVGNDVSIANVAESDDRPRRWVSKHSFLRACLEVSERRGLPLELPASPLSAQDSWDVMWAKLSGPRYGVTYGYRRDGAPLLAKRGMRLTEGDCLTREQIFAHVREEHRVTGRPFRPLSARQTPTTSAQGVPPPPSLTRQRQVNFVAAARSSAYTPGGEWRGFDDEGEAVSTVLGGGEGAADSNLNLGSNLGSNGAGSTSARGGVQLKVDVEVGWRVTVEEEKELSPCGRVWRRLRLTQGLESSRSGTSNDAEAHTLKRGVDETHRDRNAKSPRVSPSAAPRE